MEEEKENSQSSPCLDQSTSEKENTRNPQSLIDLNDETDAANILLALRSSDTSELTSSKELKVRLSFNSIYYNDLVYIIILK